MDEEHSLQFGIRSEHLEQAPFFRVYPFSQFEQTVPVQEVQPLPQF